MRFLDELKKHKDNRGMMANLRCLLVPNKKHRAWPVLHRLGIPIEKKEESYVAALYAKHPLDTGKGNFGNTCKLIELRKDNIKDKEGGLTSTERRFQHLLAANKDEVPARVLRMIMLAEREDIPVNYRQLSSDLKCWNDKIKTEWAASYWAPNAPKPDEEDQ